MLEFEIYQSSFLNLFGVVLVFMAVLWSVSQAIKVIR